MEEVFASIDDDHGVIGSSLQSRGLYPKTQKELLMLVEKKFTQKNFKQTYNSQTKTFA